ncbi:MAG: hypothetical protein JXQ72_00095 [Anaerolineae bacterium]|nr:hypothetical protein [Anaerolineae bacterium]
MNAYGELHTVALSDKNREIARSRFLCWVERYPALKLVDVYAVLACYLAQRAEVDEYMRQAD